MADDAVPNPMASIMADLAHSDGIAMAGIFAICRRLIAKGLFDAEDISSVMRNMRNPLPSEDKTDSLVMKKQARTLDEIESALTKALEAATVTPPS